MEKLIYIDENVCTRRNKTSTKASTKLNHWATQPSIRWKWNDRKMYCFHLVFFPILSLCPILGIADFLCHSIHHHQYRAHNNSFFLLIIIHQITYFAINMKHSIIEIKLNIFRKGYVRQTVAESETVSHWTWTKVTVIRTPLTSPFSFFFFCCYCFRFWVEIQLSFGNSLWCNLSFH